MCTEEKTGMERYIWRELIIALTDRRTVAGSDRLAVYDLTKPVDLCYSRNSAERESDLILSQTISP